MEKVDVELAENGEQGMVTLDRNVDDRDLTP